MIWSVSYYDNTKSLITSDGRLHHYWTLLNLKHCGGKILTFFSLLLSDYSDLLFLALQRLKPDWWCWSEATDVLQLLSTVVFQGRQFVSVLTVRDSAGTREGSRVAERLADFKLREKNNTVRAQWVHRPHSTSSTWLDWRIRADRDTNRPSVVRLITIKWLTAT